LKANLISCDYLVMPTSAETHMCNSMWCTCHIYTFYSYCRHYNCLLITSL